jgi:hypothetical protein
MPVERTVRRRVAAALVAVTAALLPALAAGSAPVGAAPGDGRDAALDWLSAELAAGGHHLSTLGNPDWGVTADALLAEAAAGRIGDPEVAATVDALLAHEDDYTTWDGLGPDFTGVRLAGPTAKTLLVAELAGRPATVTGPLEVELRSLVATGGPDAGRAADRNPHSADASNGFDQALAILALDRTSGGAPTSTIAFLLEQQCPAGGFRLIYRPSGGCTSDANADTDATALAVQSLLVVDRTPAVAASLRHAVGSLLSIQDPTSGSFVGTGPTSSANANSSGLIAQALRAAGQDAAADRAAAWVRSLQLTTATAPVTATDLGAIAYDPATLAAGHADGIGGPVHDLWQRTTAQAVLALGMPSFGAIGRDQPAPVDPGPTSSTSSTTPTSTTTSSISTSTTTTSAPPTATSTTLGSSTTTSAAEVLGVSARRPAEAATVSTGAGSAGRSLAGTGADVDGPSALALVLLIAGAAALVTARALRMRR